MDGQAIGAVAGSGHVPEPPALVGRDRELASVRSALDEVSAGAAAALLVTGEAGIGKSRFAAEAVELARRRRFAVLQGRAQPLDRSLAFAPIVEALGRFLRSCPPDERAELTFGLPLLGQLVPGLGLPDAEPGKDATVQRTRLFEATLRLLGRIASAGPVLLVIDDLHWADSGSQELLDYVLRDVAGMPVFLIATYRHEEVVASGVASLLGTIHRSVAARTIELARLRKPDVAAVLAAATGTTPAPELIELFVDRSLGVPLYVQAFGRWLAEAGLLSKVGGAAQLSPGAEVGVPPAIRDVIRERLDRLPDDEHNAVELLAVGGQQADLRLLTAVGGAAVATALDSLVMRGLVVEAEDWQTVTYRPYHPLVHEVVYETIPPQRRRDLHVRFAAAVADRGDPIALGPHVVGAGAAISAPQAARLLLDAGRAALDRFAYEDAARYLEGAFTAAEQAAPDLVAEVLTARGDALRAAGEATAAIHAWQQALERVPADDVMSRGRLHQLMADAYSDCGQIPAAVREVETALAMLGNRAPSKLHLELLLVQMTNHQRQLDVPSAAAVEDRIARLVPEVATPEAELMGFMARVGILEERARYREAAELARSYSHRLVEYPTVRLQGAQFEALDALAMGDLAGLRRANAEVAALDERIGIPGWNYRRYLYAFAEALYRGTWDEAQGIIDEFELVVARSENSRAATIGPITGAILAAYRGDDGAAERRLQLGRDRLERGLIEPRAARGVLGIFGALVALERADAATGLERIEPVAGPSPYVLCGVIPPWGLMALAEARARTGDAAGARTAAGQLAEVGPDGTYPPVMARRLAALAAHAEGDHDEARRLLLEARSGFEQLRLPFETARATIEAAEVDCAAPGHTDLLASAHRVAVTLGAKRYEARAARLLREAGATVPRGGRPDRGGLTERQREVANLVATGLSNAEIAERLFVSTRTVTAHLDHIYTRLGINSRAALATYVTERRQRHALD